ncbi:hypothetical protein QYM36_006317 [Artemia franciscana]|uniref:Homeobox domain-containing protein n=1 Tax=Artemia franciscana TaxID=6661 RepID=A0AA88L3H6_ARTSF|nr:hypothetical protein QYM36_006317 [Artemia franciscana]
MNSFLGVGEAYSVKHIQRLLLESYGDRVLITDLPGKASIVTFRETAHFILNEHRTLPKDQSEDVEIMNMIKTVARIIKNEAKSLPPLSEEYPSFKSLDNVETCLSYLPKSLRLLLCELIPGENENIAVAALGQAIVQTCLPRTVLAPLQVFVAVQLHHHFGSRFLIDNVHKLGFCSSYKEVLRFERNAAASHGTGLFLQFAADNVDHDVCMIDGKGTFHLMGIIAIVSPKTKTTIPSIPRMEINAETLKDIAGMTFHFYNRRNKEGAGMVYKTLQSYTTSEKYSSSEQHVTATAARIQRDTKDLLTFLEFLLENSPFTSSTELRSIGSGLIAHKGVNAEDAKAVKVWFQNRRTKHKRVQTDDEEPLQTSKEGDKTDPSLPREPSTSNQIKQEESESEIDLEESEDDEDQNNEFFSNPYLITSERARKMFVFMALMEYMLVNILLGDSDGPKPPPEPPKPDKVFDLAAKETARMLTGQPPRPPGPTPAQIARMRALNVDRFSRYFFPLSFFFLNLTYWLVFLPLSMYSY